MTHEFKQIVEAGLSAKRNNLKSVLASVVALDGSSYRRPGVRMLLLEDGAMIGAVSGGCVEKEIWRQAASVFKTGVPKMMMYDGRYRLGCEGALYILIERFNPSDGFYPTFKNWIKNRNHFHILSHFEKKEGEIGGIGSQVKFEGASYSISDGLKHHEKTSLSMFKQTITPCFKLMIIGSEHDAVKLCKYSALTGWETTIVSSPSEDKTLDNFPGATDFQAVTPETLDVSCVDNQTAIVLMTHSFATDLRFLVALKDTKPAYVGLLGPVARRDDLLSQFFEYCLDVDSDFIDLIHGPAGLNIGAETPEEIAISILSEILSVVRNHEPMFLSQKQGSIHTQ